MRRVAILGASEPLAVRLKAGLEAQGWSAVEVGPAAARLEESIADRRIQTLFHAAGLGSRRPGSLAADASVLARAVDAGIGHLVVLSSAAVNEPNWHSQCLLPESRPSAGRTGNPVPGRWLALEEQARRAVEGSSALLTLLRPAATPIPGGDDFWSRLFRGRIAFTVPGFDPSLQLLALDDLASAITRAVQARKSGVFNIAPRSVIPLRKALRLAGVQRVPAPRLLQWPVRKIAASLGFGATIDELDYIRYPWTVADGLARQELGFSPRYSSAESLELLLPRTDKAATRRPRQPAKALDSFDPYGLDREYTARLGRRMFRPLHDMYWRIEHEGLEHIPASGRGVLTGVHRGFQPWDAVMTVHLVSRELGRHPRILIHPTLVKFPFLAPYITKLGGLHACRANAARVLEDDKLLGIYPEGIRGAFSYYRDAYRLGKFGRDEFVKIALRHQAPIIPFVTVGAAEIFPILAKLNWGWWKRHVEWPCFPITPTMGLVPLPSKWHTTFLEPLHIEERYEPEAADDPAVVRSISLEVRHSMERAIERMLGRRRSIFFGSLFDERAA